MHIYKYQSVLYMYIENDKISNNIFFFCVEKMVISL